MQAIRKAIQALAEHPLTARFVKTLNHSDLPVGWQNNPEIVSLAEAAWRDAGTDSPFFRAWAGSNLVDTAHGPPTQQPKTGNGFVTSLFHGSPSSKIDEFDRQFLGSATGGGGTENAFFFVDNKNTARNYAEKANPVELGTENIETFPIRDALGRHTFEYARNANDRKIADMLDEMFPSRAPHSVVPEMETRDIIDTPTVHNLYVAPKNPLVMDVVKEAKKEARRAGVDWNSFVKEQNINADKYGRDSIAAHRFLFPDHDFHGFIDDAVSNALSSRRDAAVLKNLIDDNGALEDVWRQQAGQTHVAVLDPTRIKSPSNRGTFDPADPNIFRSLAPPRCWGRLGWRRDGDA